MKFMGLYNQQENILDKEKAKSVFNNLTAGDTITTAKTELVVLRSKLDGGKLFGRMCGEHAHPYPFYFKWSDGAGMPSNEQGVGMKWEDVEVVKEAKPKLAAMYYDFPVDDDFLTDEFVNRAMQTPKEVMERLSAITMSEAHEAFMTVATLRTMGVGITDEQAFMAWNVLEARRESQDKGLGDLFTRIGEIFKRPRQEPRDTTG